MRSPAIQRRLRRAMSAALFLYAAGAIGQIIIRRADRLVRTR